MADHQQPAQRQERAQSESSKRVRVSQACASCRSRKSKCDGARPACWTCRALSQPCVYDPNPKKRGVPAGQSSLLERRIILMELVSSYLADGLDGDANQTVWSFLALNQDSSVAEVESWNIKATTLLEKWRTGPIIEWVQEMATRSNIFDDLFQSRSQELPPESVSHSVREDEVRDPKGQTEPTAQAQGCRGNEAAHFNSNISAQCAAHPMPLNSQRYLDTYFAYVHTWLPLVDKFKIISFAQHTLSDRRQVRLSNQDSGNLALLWAIIACASPHISDQQPSPEAKTISSREAYLNARSMLPVDDSNFKPEHIQALILLSLCQFELGSWKSSWVLIGLAGRLAVDIKAPTSSLTPHHMLSSERRTCLACFVVEGLIAAYLGRDTQHVALRSLNPKPHIAADIRWQLEEDGWEEWSDWVEPDQPSDSATSIQSRHGPSRSLSTFNQLVRLVEVMNRVSFAANSFGARQKHRAINLDISRQLDDWYGNLEESYSFLELSKAQKPLLHVVNLNLIYWGQRCTLYVYDPVSEAGTERAKFLATKVNEVILLYKASYKVALSSLIILNAVTAAIPLVASSSALGAQLRGYLEEIQQAQAKAKSLEKPGMGNKALNNSNDSATWYTGRPGTMQLEETLGTSIAVSNNILQPETGTQDRLRQSENGRRDLLSPRRTISAKGKQPARASTSAQSRIPEGQRSLQVDIQDIANSNLPLHNGNLTQNTSRGQNKPVPGLSLDPNLSLFYPPAPDTVSGQNSNGISEHDLTFLDAMNWTDDSLARNFGYVGDFSGAQELYDNLEEYSFDIPNHQ